MLLLLHGPCTDLKHEYLGKTDIQWFGWMDGWMPKQSLVPKNCKVSFFSISTLPSTVHPSNSLRCFLTFHFQDKDQSLPQPARSRVHGLAAVYFLSFLYYLPPCSQGSHNFASQWFFKAAVLLLTPGSLHRLVSLYPSNSFSLVASNYIIHYVAHLVSVFSLEWKLQEGRDCIHFAHCLSPEPKQWLAMDRQGSKYLLNEQMPCI